jgi:hypothetical protein
MVTSIKQLRQALDQLLIQPSELRGKIVKIGFLTLTVTGYEETPGNYLPNVWLLTNGPNNYRFTPQHGLVRQD